jgi:phage shock protein PspC (stress-responsive transcriptional regulator)
MIMEMMANSEEGMVAGVALGIAVFIALSAGIYFGWTLGLKYFS